MKAFLLLTGFILLLTLFSCKTKQIAELRNKTCDCFDSIKYDGDKLKFQMAEQSCVTELYYGVLTIQPSFPDKSNFELMHILHNELKEKCDSWNEVMTLYFQLSEQSTKTRIESKAQCDVLKNGQFKEIGEKMTFTVTDSIQITRYIESGAYTKSKINWIDSCTYQIMPFETTDSITQRHLLENPIFTITIIDVINDTIIYENEFNGGYSMGQFIKMK
jgi:hypothetical protein